MTEENGKKILLEAEQLFAESDEYERGLPPDLEKAARRFATGGLTDEAHAKELLAELEEEEQCGDENYGPNN